MEVSEPEKKHLAQKADDWATGRKNVHCPEMNSHLPIQGVTRFAEDILVFLANEEYLIRDEKGIFADFNKVTTIPNVAFNNTHARFGQWICIRHCMMATVIPKCKILHGCYLSKDWEANPSKLVMVTRLTDIIFEAFIEPIGSFFWVPLKTKNKSEYGRRRVEWHAHMALTSMSS